MSITLAGECGIDPIKFSQATSLGPGSIHNITLKEAKITLIILASKNHYCNEFMTQNNEIMKINKIGTKFEMAKLETKLKFMC